MSGKNITIEFSNPENNLNCKIIKHQNYPTGSKDLYIDNEQLCINRTERDNKTFINFVQPNIENSTTDNIKLSIFSKNGNHIPDLNSSNSY